MVPELTVSGSPYEIGYQHGSFFSRQINAFLNDRLARINILRPTPLDRDDALSKALDYASWIESDVPDIAEELRGLAAGAGILYEEAVLLQIRRELTRRQSCSGDCSSMAFVRDGQIVLAQTIDLACRMGDFACVLRITPTNPHQPAICMFTFMGLCGYAGINSSGLAIGLNMVFTDDWRPGVSPYLLIRHLLTKHSIADVLNEIKRIHRASSRYLVLTDSKSLIGIEMLVDDLRVIEDSTLLHTNHYTHADFQKLDRLKEPALSHSRMRLERMSELVNCNLPVENILKDHSGYPRSICAHSLGDETLTDTVGAVIMVPGKGELQTLVGHPCENTFHRHQLPEPAQHV